MNSKKKSNIEMVLSVSSDACIQNLIIFPLYLNYAITLGAMSYIVTHNLKISFYGISFLLVSSLSST